MVSHAFPGLLVGDYYSQRTQVVFAILKIITFPELAVCIPFDMYIRTYRKVYINSETKYHNNNEKLRDCSSRTLPHDRSTGQAAIRWVKGISSVKIVLAEN
jgi:hypothetical protein